MEADLKTLKERVLEAAQGSPVVDNIADVVLEADRDDDGSGFVRVIIQVKDFAHTDDEALEKLLERIEASLSSADDRYASVRFSDAA